MSPVALAIVATIAIIGLWLIIRTINRLGRRLKPSAEYQARMAKLQAEMEASKAAWQQRREDEANQRISDIEDRFPGIVAETIKLRDEYERGCALQELQSYPAHVLRKIVKAPNDGEGER